MASAAELAALFKITAVCLYADLADSTDLVDSYTAKFAAKLYKSYLHCASKLIRRRKGVITSFDGDRVMGVFYGDSMHTDAANCALNINHAVVKIINPAITKKYPNTKYTLRHGVGLDVSDLFVARSGIRGSNDLVWIGRSANYAAKLSAIRQGTYASWMTEDVFSGLEESAKKSSNDSDMWDQMTWTDMDGGTIYGSSWWRRP